MEIAADNLYSSELTVIIAPELNISEVLSRLDLTHNSSIKRVNYQLDPELDALAVAIQEEKASERIIARVDWHHAHHYAVIYIIVGIIGAIAGWMVVKKLTTKKDRQVEIVMPNIPAVSPRTMMTVPTVNPVNGISFP